MVFAVAGSALHTLVRSAEPAQNQMRPQELLSFKDLIVYHAQEHPA